MYKFKKYLVMLKLLNKEIKQLVREVRMKFHKAMSFHPQFCELKNEYYFRTVDKRSREIVDKPFNQLRDIMIYYKNEVTKCDTKHYYLVRKFNNKENVIQL